MKKLFQDLKLPSGNNKYDVWIFAICIYCLFMPCFLWQFSYKPFLFVCAFLSIKNFGVGYKGNKLFLAVFMLLLYLYIGIISSWSFFGIIFLLLLIPIFFANSKFIKQSLDVFIYIFSIMLIPSILQYIFVLIFRIDMPHTVITSLNTDKVGVYSQYLFMVNYSGGEILLDSILPRFYSYFDEPGVVGTIAAVILCVNKFNLKSWINIPIFIAGILSFSLVFFLIALIYLFIFVKMKYKLIFIPILILLLFVLADFEVFKFYIVDRLNIDSNFIESFLTRRDGGEAFESWYSHFKQTPQFFTGMGAGYSQIVNQGGSSFKNLIVEFGFVFFILYLAAFVLYGIRFIGFNKELVIALLILFTVIYQRPFIQDFAYIYLIYAPFVFLQVEKREDLLQLKNERKRRRLQSCI